MGWRWKNLALPFSHHAHSLHVLSVIDSIPCALQPSHLDWTFRAADAGLVPFACEYPNSLNITAHGFVDAYRSIYADEVSDPGFSWPGFPVDYEYRPDRIDFIYAAAGVASAGAGGLSVLRAHVLEGHSPSDHRAVLAEFFVTS